MPRAKGREIELRFRGRYEARARAKCQIPAVRDAIEGIRFRAAKLYDDGHRFQRWSAETHTDGWQGGDPFCGEVSICYSNGLHVWVDGNTDGSPIVTIQLTTEEEQGSLAARLVHPQRLLAASEYDLWEIRRDAPISRILEDIEAQRKEIDRDRAELQIFTQAGKLGRQLPRLLRGCEIYRRRVEGEPWADIARGMNCHKRTAKKVVDDLCAEMGLPKPQKGVVDAGILELSQCRDNDCPDRTVASEVCARCPFRKFLANMEANESKEQYILVGGDEGLEDAQAEAIKRTFGWRKPPLR